MRATVDANEAAVWVAFRCSEVCCIYPITPSSPMAEFADEWSSKGRTNLWGTVPAVVEMQSEGGAAGALHGALQGGALGTTFTASQGLLLMIPNMYKIAGELTSVVMHVAARSLAAQALSIFGDHSDVMAVRQTGFALLSAASVQEAHDLALVAHAATLETRVPFLHFFDGFRTSHELQTIEMLDDDDVRALISDELVRAHRARALSPERPFIRGTAQNPDIYFQARESVNPFYARLPEVVQSAMDRLGERTGRRYGLVDYSGDPEAERVVVVMGSGGETARETVAYLQARGERVGVAQVRLYRPFPARELAQALPGSVRRVAVLDRTKEPGSFGEPLFLDVLAALNDAYGAGEREAMPTVIGGRYGLSSKEFTPGMVAGVFEELARERPKRRFTIGINDDVSATSLPYDASLDIEPSGHGSRRVLRAGFRWDGRREQEHDQDPRRRREPARPGLLRLRLQEVGLADRLAPALRTPVDPRPVPRLGRELRRLPPVRADRALRGAGSCRPRRDAAAELPRGARIASGTRSRAPCRRRSSPSGSSCTRSTPGRSHAKLAWLGARTRCSRRASSRSRACSSASRRSRRSRRRSRRPTASAAPRS